MHICGSCVCVDILVNLCVRFTQAELISQSKFWERADSSWDSLSPCKSSVEPATCLRGIQRILLELRQTCLAQLFELRSRKAQATTSQRLDSHLRCAMCACEAVEANPGCFSTFDMYCCMSDSPRLVHMSGSHCMFT